jgi:hypothetical protein
MFGPALDLVKLLSNVYHKISFPRDDVTGAPHFCLVLRLKMCEALPSFSSYTSSHDVTHRHLYLSDSLGEEGKTDSPPGLMPLII